MRKCFSEAQVCKPCTVLEYCCSWKELAPPLWALRSWLACWWHHMLKKHSGLLAADLLNACDERFTLKSAWRAPDFQWESVGFYLCFTVFYDLRGYVASQCWGTWRNMSLWPWELWQWLWWQLLLHQSNLDWNIWLGWLADFHADILNGCGYPSLASVMWDWGVCCCFFFFLCRSQLTWKFSGERQLRTAEGHACKWQPTGSGFSECLADAGFWQLDVSRRMPPFFLLLHASVYTLGQNGQIHGIKCKSQTCCFRCTDAALSKTHFFDRAS